MYYEASLKNCNEINDVPARLATPAIKVYALTHTWWCSENLAKLFGYSFQEWLRKNCIRPNNICLVTNIDHTKVFMYVSLRASTGGWLEGDRSCKQDERESKTTKMDHSVRAILYPLILCWGDTSIHLQMATKIIPLGLSFRGVLSWRD